jgi:adenylate kinase
MEVIMIFGLAGSGKGTQAELLAKNLSLVHISTGQLLRNEIAKKTELGKLADSIINKGNLIPDEIIIDIIKEFLEKNKDKKILFDGFPRTVPQAKSLLDMLKHFNTKNITLINLDIPREEAIKRLLHRAQIEGRKDDNEQAINKRLDIYYEQTKPILTFLKNNGVKIIDVDGIGLIENIQEDILEKLEN